MYTFGKVVVFDMLIAIFDKNYGSFSPKILCRIFLSEFVSGYFKTKKTKQKNVIFSTKLEGGGGSGRATKKKNFFCGFHKQILYKKKQGK